MDFLPLRPLVSITIKSTTERRVSRAPRARAVRQMPTEDIAAILAVIIRRPETERQRKKRERWQFDLRGTDLRGANLGDPLFPDGEAFPPHLEGIKLSGAHLEGAHLTDAHLELEGADLTDAHLEGAYLVGTRFEGAYLGGAHFEGAYLSEAHFEGAYLHPTVGLSQAQLSEVYGDDSTLLPEGMIRPGRWPSSRRSRAA
jgi:hypothetical protein